MPFRRHVLLATPAFFPAVRAGAQTTWPDRPLRIIVPFAAGGGQDITARILAEPLRAAFGQAVVVENRPGASGMIGAQYVAQAPADGTTLLLAGAGETAINQHLYKDKMAYDPLRDLRPVSLVGKVPVVVMAWPEAPFRDMAALVAYARANPGKLSYSSSGTGNAQHLCGELLNRIAGIDTVHVPYRGSAPALLDTATGRVQFGYNSLASGLTLIREGRIRVLAVTSKERMPQLPDTPSISEVPGLASYELVNYFGVFVSAATPEPIQQRLNAALVGMQAAGPIREKLSEQGLLPQTMNLSEASAYVAQESAKFGKLVAEAGVTPES
jgi:tripartite-type tricarboxylate transporter receptor subunit TctC